MMTHLLFILLVLSSSSMAFAQVQAEWSESEHFELAEVGALKACTELNIPVSICPIKNIERADRKIAFRYGDLVAAADFYNTPLDMDSDRRTGIRNVIRCTHAAVNDLPDPTPKTSDTSNCTLAGFLSIPGYLEVLTQNYGHFGWNNMVAYVANHQLALKRAQDAFLLKDKNPRQSQRLLHQALIFNGFADHYLTDAFSSGHIRAPRIQLKKWAIKTLKGALLSYRGDLLSLVIHDHESLNLRTGREEGLRVKNSFGDIWMTHGDGELHANTDSSDLGFIMPMSALKQSFKEVMVTWQTGQIPDGIFKAAEYVPFHNDVPLATKFSAEYQKMPKKEMLHLIYSSIPFLEGLWFHKSDVERMLEALPGIFLAFQADVAKEIQSNQSLQQRLPAAYLDAYKKVD